MINGKVKKKTVESANIFEVEVDTNTPQGGDAGQGGRTYFKLSDKGNTAWAITVKKDGIEETTIEYPGSLEISLFGDSEVETFIESLMFAASELRKMNAKQTTINKRREKCPNYGDPRLVKEFIREAIEHNKLPQIEHMIRTIDGSEFAYMKLEITGLKLEITMSVDLMDKLA